MPTFTVTTLADTINAGDGKLSLREALTAANADSNADVIAFAPQLEGGQLVLAQGELQILSDIIIVADSNNDGLGIGIDAHFASRVLAISGLETDVNLSGLKIEQGYTDGNGGGIYHNGKTLTISNSDFAGNTAGGGSTGEYSYSTNDTSGGAIFASGYLMVNSVTVHDNWASTGGGIALTNGYIVNSAIYSNNSRSDNGGTAGAGIDAGALRLVNSSVTDNHAYGLSSALGGGINANYIFAQNSTIAGNSAFGFEGYSYGAGINAQTVVAIGATITDNSMNSEVRDDVRAGITAANIHLTNSIVTGNVTYLSRDSNGVVDYRQSDVYQITVSNGHNVLGAISGGSIEGDILGTDPAAVFLAVDPTTGGGKLVLSNGDWVVPLRDALDDPALSGADPASAADVDQRGALRPQPGSSNPDIGAYELNQGHISTAASVGNDVLTGTAAVNTLDGLVGNDLLLGLGGSDTLRGNAGSDTLQGGLGDDRLEGGAGNDTASFRDATGAVQANLFGNQSHGAAGVDTLVSIENLVGGNGNDSLGGNTGNNAVSGLGGNDKLYGNTGDDILRGGAGDDSLWAGFGNDVMDGGAGRDTANYIDAIAAVQVNLTKGGAAANALGVDRLISIENVTGSNFNDSLGGDAKANTLMGGLGADKLYGDAGSDSLQGQDDNDILFGFTGDDSLDGGAGIDTASYADITSSGVRVSLAITTAQDTGGGGRDTLVGMENLIGGSLADSLVGSSGVNTLTGGLGRDTQTGGLGNDLFDFNAQGDSGLGGNADWIMDFKGVGAVAGDRLDFADLSPGTLSFKGTSAFTGANQVRVLASGSDTIVQVNLSGSTAPEMEIHVQDGSATPGQWVGGDFIL